MPSGTQSKIIAWVAVPVGVVFVVALFMGWIGSSAVEPDVLLLSLLGWWPVLLPIVVLWVVPCYVCYQQGKAKNRNGLAWGLLLGWLGVLALAALPRADVTDG